jgi:hypothetical protein
MDAIAEAAYQWEKDLADPQYDESFPQKDPSDYNEHAHLVSATPDQTDDYNRRVEAALAALEEKQPPDASSVPSIKDSIADAARRLNNPPTK